MEEWDRCEALHEDVDKQVTLGPSVWWSLQWTILTAAIHTSPSRLCKTKERTEERLQEEELEVVWEKGGSGLVFYTDASYWDHQDGGRRG